MTRSKRNSRTKALQNLRKAAIARVEAARDVASARVDEARSRTFQVVTQLEKVFEERVSKAISRLGVPSAKEVRALALEVAQLKASVARLRRARG
jgi:poly(hydroxyalkanoate) granule-associated protein